MNEWYGPWREVSQCVECDVIVPKEVKWMSPFFEPTCPSCGATNDRPWVGLFRPVIARRVGTRFLNRFVRWDFRAERGTDHE